MPNKQRNDSEIVFRSTNFDRKNFQYISTNAYVKRHRYFIPKLGPTLVIKQIHLPEIKFPVSSSLHLSKTQKGQTTTTTNM